MPTLRPGTAVHHGYSARVPRRAPALAVVLLLVAPAAADAAERKPRSIHQSKDLWATVNICDTERHPNAIGIRGSMPGSGFRDERMWMRFQVQYKRPSDGKWHNTGPAGDSGFVRVGSARIKRREAGRTFTLDPPAQGAWRLRGVVTFEWRRDGEVVRRARKQTTRGHTIARGGDPKGFSASRCVIR
jgi:hypothetical protein